MRLLGIHSVMRPTDRVFGWVKPLVSFHGQSDLVRMVPNLGGTNWLDSVVWQVSLQKPLLCKAAGCAPLLEKAFGKAPL